MVSNLKQSKTSSDERPTGGNPRTGGRDIYCCIPECGSSQHDRNMNKTNIALFSFPNKEKKAAVYKSWCNEIHKFRRKGGKDGFTISYSELHFKLDETKTTLGRGIKALKTGMEVPSVFLFKKQNKTK